MNFQHLKYFLMVAEELNITRAAERLYISQQSLSNHIGNLERELDVKLFTRSPKLSLTYAGGLLVDTATQILDLHSQYLSKVGDINKQYIYQLAFKKFIADHQITIVKNCFLLPTEKKEIVSKGVVKLDMLSSLGLEDIQIREIPTDMLFNYYLNRKRIDIRALQL